MLSLDNLTHRNDEMNSLIKNRHKQKSKFMINRNEIHLNWIFEYIENALKMKLISFLFRTKSSSNTSVSSLE